MSKRKPKVEAPKEAWAVVSPQNSAVINFARTMVPEGFAEVRYVPADPRRDAVVKAAARWAAAHESGVSLAEDMTQCELRAAVEKRQRGGR